MNDDRDNPPPDARVEVLLKGERHRSEPGPRMPLGAGHGGPQQGLPDTGFGRLLAFAFLGLLFLVMINVFLQSFEPRVEWVDSAGRAMLEERPVFWPLILFSLVGRMLCGLAAWYPSFSDPTRGLFRVADSPPLQKRRLLFRVMYGTGLVLAIVTLFNNLAFSDILGIARAVAIVVLILAGMTLLFRYALLSFLSRLSVQVQRRR